MSEKGAWHDLQTTRQFRTVGEQVPSAYVGRQTNQFDGVVKLVWVSIKTLDAV